MVVAIPGFAQGIVDGVRAAFGVETLAEEGQWASDPDTHDAWYSGENGVSSGDNAGDSTRNTGRIWTDKSVYTSDVQLTSQSGETTFNIENDEGTALVGLSALSSAANISGQTTINQPLDIVLVLDVSGSMTQGRLTSYEGAGPCGPVFVWGTCPGRLRSCPGKRGTCPGRAQNRPYQPIWAFPGQVGAFPGRAGDAPPRRTWRRGDMRWKGRAAQGETKVCMDAIVSLAGLLSETFACTHAIVSAVRRSETFACMDTIVSLAGVPSETSACTHAFVSPPPRPRRLPPPPRTRRAPSSPRLRPARPTLRQPPRPDKEI